MEEILEKEKEMLIESQKINQMLLVRLGLKNLEKIHRGGEEDTKWVH